MEIVFDLTGNLDKYKEHVVRLKENAIYRIKLEFYVQRDIISGLKLTQLAYKGPLRSNLVLQAILIIFIFLFSSTIVLFIKLIKHRI